jgi:1,4-dihydroxy-2-naphthoate octaprenyltransferase
MLKYFVIVCFIEGMTLSPILVVLLMIFVLLSVLAIFFNDYFDNDGKLDSSKEKSDID